MIKRTRVLWNEGLLLSPQHLQLQDRYQEERSTELFRAARPFGYGLTRLILDDDAIKNGQVILHEAAGVLPGGSPFSVPDRDEAPAGRTIEGHFPLADSEIPLFLGLRIHRPGQAQVARGGAGLNPESRYLEDAVHLADETTGESSREVRIARSNLRLLFAEENVGDYEALPVAQIVRRPEGGFAFKSDYIPPCLAIGASDVLLRILRKLLEILVAKSTELADRRRFSGKGAAEFGRDDTAGFWLLGTVNGYVPLLAHSLRGAVNHPETVYLLLAELAGKLTTLSDQQVRDIPPFDQDQPGTAFHDLADRIPRLLETVLPRNYTRIPLTKRDDLVHVGRILDDRLLEPAAAFFLGAYANMPTGELQTGLPEMIKIASPDRVDFLVAHALKGMNIRLVQTLPAALPVQSGYVYFQMDKVGDAWDGIAGSRTLAIYVPPEYPGILLELVAVRT